MTYLPFFGLFILIALAFCAYILLAMRRRRLRGAARLRVQKAWKHATSLSDLRLRVMEADKVLDLALSLLGYRGSLGEKLKQASSRFPHVDDVWQAHKLRNRLAHELSVSLSAREAESAVRSLHQALTAIGL